MANFQPFISTKSAQKSLCSYVRELEGVHARNPQLVDRLKIFCNFCEWNLSLFRNILRLLFDYLKIIQTKL